MVIHTAKASAAAPKELVSTRHDDDVGVYPPNLTLSLAGRRLFYGGKFTDVFVRTADRCGDLFSTQTLFCFEFFARQTLFFGYSIGRLEDSRFSTYLRYFFPHISCQ